MSKKTAAAPKLSDLSKYKFDTSKYLEIKSTVTRDNKTGSLTSKPKPKKSA
jgi:hypothetical protein